MILCTVIAPIKICVAIYFRINFSHACQSNLHAVATPNLLSTDLSLKRKLRLIPAYAGHFTGFLSFYRLFVTRSFPTGHAYDDHLPKCTSRRRQSLYAVNRFFNGMARLGVSYRCWEVGVRKSVKLLPVRTYSTKR